LLAWEGNTMDLNPIGAIPKSISGILVGIFTGIILLLYDFGWGWYLFFSVLLAYYLLFAGVIDIILTIPATILLLILDNALHFMDKISAMLGIADVFKNSIIENFGNLTFRFVSLYMISLTLVTLLNMLWKPGYIPPVVYLVAGLIIGPLIGIIYWNTFHLWLPDSIWTILIWGVIGGALGLLASIPGPPID
jgi:hypothetical protein